MGVLATNSIEGQPVMDVCTDTCVHTVGENLTPKLNALKHQTVQNHPLPSPPPILPLSQQENPTQDNNIVSHCFPNTPISFQRLQIFLTGYNQNTLAFLIDGFISGFHLQFQGKRGFQNCQNLKSALDDPNNVQKKIDKEIKLKRILGPFKEKPFPHLKLSPLGLVPKKKPNEFRLIHHLSYPRNDSNSVNAGIPREYSTVHYATIDDAIARLKICGRGAFMAKTDIESAYRIVPVHPDDHELLGFSWDGQYYFDTCLPMGCSSACQIFETFSTALEWMALNKLGCSHVVHILDDFLFLEVSQTRASRALNKFLDACTTIGIPISDEKTIFPTQEIEFLGIVLDSTKFEARLPPDKQAKCTRLLHQFLLKEKCSLRELQSLIGLLNFACIVVPPGRPFLRRLINLTIGASQPYHHIRITSDVKEDLKMWLAFLESFNGRSFFLQDKFLSSDTLQLFTDAASTVGFGAVYGNKWFNGSFLDNWKNFHISILEFYPILLAVRVWGSLWKNHSILFFTDNEALVSVINKQTSKDNILLTMVRWLVLQCLRNNILFKAKHIPGKKNVLADSLSRLQMSRFRDLAPSAQVDPSPIPVAFLPPTFFETLKHC